MGNREHVSVENVPFRDNKIGNDATGIKVEGVMADIHCIERPPES